MKEFLLYKGLAFLDGNMYIYLPGETVALPNSPFTTTETITNVYFWLYGQYTIKVTDSQGNILYNLSDTDFNGAVSTGLIPAGSTISYNVVGATTKTYNKVRWYAVSKEEIEKNLVG